MLVVSNYRKSGNLEVALECEDCLAFERQLEDCFMCLDWQQQTEY